MFVYLANEPSLNLNLDSTIKQVNLKYNNAFVNKITSMGLDLSVCVCIILFVYMNTSWLSKFRSFPQKRSRLV